MPGLTGYVETRDCTFFGAYICQEGSGAPRPIEAKMDLLRAPGDHRWNPSLSNLECDCMPSDQSLDVLTLSLFCSFSDEKLYDLIHPMGIELFSADPDDDEEKQRAELYFGMVQDADWSKINGRSVTWPLLRKDRSTPANVRPLYVPSGITREDGRDSDYDPVHIPPKVAFSLMLNIGDELFRELTEREANQRPGWFAEIRGFMQCGLRRRIL